MSFFYATVSSLSTFKNSPVSIKQLFYFPLFKQVNVRLMFISYNKYKQNQTVRFLLECDEG